MSVDSLRAVSTGAQGAGRAEQLCSAALKALAAGNWPEAFSATDRCLRITDPMTHADVVAQVEAAAGIVAAVQGEASTARELLRRSQCAAARLGMSDLLDLVQLGRGVEALTAGRYDEALVQLRQLVDLHATSSAWVRTVALGYLAEAWLRCGGECPGATTLTREDLLDRASAAPRGVTAYVRAIALVEGTDEDVFAAALAGCPLDRHFDRARINLARGARLRRERRVTESRQPLHEALAVFERLGATAWADQARSELRATGARRHHREPTDPEPLTAQELRIVRMAAEGLTNREIGQRLFLSHRTIGSHLYRAFPKLGIAARSQLRDLLPQLVQPDQAPSQVAP